MINQIYNTKSKFFANAAPDFPLPTTEIEFKLLKEYGAVFVAGNGVKPPPKIVFENQAEVLSWQSKLSKSETEIGGHSLQLQTEAMRALINAAGEARQQGLSLTPRGADSAGRDYAGTIDLWASRVLPGLAHWVSNGRLSRTKADRIASLTPFEQVSEIFALEAEGMFFARELSKSIIYSVAPPGASQHLALLAFDVAEFNDPVVRAILANHGWFQTVVSDLPHFTYLGFSETELKSLGLKKTIYLERDFWLPDI